MHRHEGQTGILIDSQGHTLLGTLFLGFKSGPRPTALLLHGIPGIEKNYDLAHALRDFGWNAVIFHYRGCWGSAGNYSIATIPQDVSAAIDCLTQGLHPQVDGEKIVAIGHSLGGWAAVLAADRDRRIRAFSSIAGVLDPDRFPLSDPAYAQHYTPWLSGISPSELADQWAGLSEADQPILRSPGLREMPVLLIHGDADEEVEPGHTTAFSSALPYPHELEIVPGADHNLTCRRDWLKQRLLDWCANLF